MRPIDLDQRGKVFLGQPEPGARRVPGDDHQPIVGDPRQLGQAKRAIRPVVDGEDGQRRGEGGMPKREIHGGRLHDRSASHRALTDHRQ